MKRRPAARWAIVVGVLLTLIVVPFVIWGTAIEVWIGQWLAQEHSSWARLAVIVALLSSDVLLPIPSSVVSVAAGMSLGWWLGTLAGATGMTLGCVVGYAIGRRLGRPGLSKVVDPQDVERFELLSNRFGDVAVLLTRAVPVLAEAGVILAGAAKMKRARFLAVCAGANVVVSVVYATLGDLAVRSEQLELAAAAALILPSVAIVASRRWFTRHNEA